MAELALSVQVFVASSSDVQEERRSIRKALKRTQRRVARLRVLLRPFLWEHDTAAFSGAPQPPLQEELQRSEFVIIVIWSRIGPGTEAELKGALDPAQQHRFDTTAIYFKAAPPPESASAADLQRVRDVKNWIRDENLALTRDFTTPTELRMQIESQLNQWIDHYWVGLPEACEFALRHSGPVNIGHRSAPMRWQRIRERFRNIEREEVCPLAGHWAVSRYAEQGMTAANLPLPPHVVDVLRERLDLVGDEPFTPTDLQRASESYGSPLLSPKPFRRDDNSIFFSDLEWFYFFCAFGVSDAIVADERQLIMDRAFTNPIHQYLKAIAGARQLTLGPRLMEWLANRNGATAQFPVLRNFAAYVLGMLEIREASDVVAQALQNDFDPTVRLYCATSLGKLKSRRHRPLLMQLFARADDPSFRLIVSQALCRMIGLVDFEL